MLNQLLPWTSLLGPALGALVALVGWFVLHRFNVQRDRENKRRELITTYLLEAYRRMETAANREDKTEEQAVAFESAIADIQLLGSPAQFAATLKYIDARAGNGEQDAVGIGHVLGLLRDDLRRELGLAPLITPPRFFRFVRELGSGDWRGNPIPTTPLVGAAVHTPSSASGKHVMSWEHNRYEAKCDTCGRQGFCVRSSDDWN